MTPRHGARGSAFDAEEYLRELSERTIGDQGVLWRYRRTPLLAAVQALVAVGCIDEGAGQRVLDAHEAERRRRDPDLAIGWKRQWPHAAIAPRRIALGQGEVGDSERATRVRYVVFGPDSTTIAASLRGAWGGAPPCVRVSDERGKRVPAGFSGAGSDEGWEGELQCHLPLDDATRWIEIDGLRVPLADAASRADVRVEALPGGDPAPRHLWHVAALTTPHPLGDACLDDAIGALVAAGALADDEPQLATLRAVRSALALDGRRRRRAAAKLPEPWSALWRRRHFAGPARTIAVGAVTPLFDGIAVAVDALESSAKEWSIRVEFVPEGASPRPYEAPTARLISLVWWAEDDRDNRYLAQPGALGGNASGGRGELRFDEPLDPQAKWVELRPTSQASQAAIRIPLD